MTIVNGIKKDKATKKKLHDLPPLEGDEEKHYRVPITPLSKGIKEGKGLKILTRHPILLVQMKDRSNSNKLKNEIRQIVCLLYQHNIITKSHYNNRSALW